MSKLFHIGTCAWSFDDWKGPFYPRGMRAQEFLSHYARFLDTVEVDSTFYSTPPLHTVRAWHERTPENFLFCCKVPKAISHEARLQNCHVELHTFLTSIAALGNKLSCLLLQLPPGFTARDEPLLRRFLQAWPREFRLAVEFRHPSWNTPHADHLLEHHHVSLVWQDLTGPGSGSLAAFGHLPVTGPVIYLRLLGDIASKYRPDGSRHHTYGQILWNKDRDIAEWAVKLRRTAAATGRPVHVFFNNHYEGFSIESCMKLRRLLELPAGDYRAAAREGSQMKLGEDRSGEQVGLL